MSLFKQNRLIMIVLGLISLISMGLLAFSTRWGPGVGGDATIYLTVARNLVEGKGLGLIGPQGEFRLLPYFPPFFSLVLSFLGSLGCDYVLAARWVNILCFGGLVYGAGYAVNRYSRSIFWASLSALVLAFSPILMPVYSWAMSEPLSALLGFAGLLLVLGYLEKPKDWILWTAGLLVGLSFLTRYAALAFMLTAGLALLIWLKRPLRQRLLKGIVFGVIGSVPMLVWVIYDWLNTTTVGSRRILSWQEMGSRFFSFWPSLNDTVLLWLIPESWFYNPVYPSIINSLLIPFSLLFLMVWLGLIIWMIQHKKINLDSGLYRLLGMLAGFSVLYLFIILAVYLTTYPPITIANRMLSPVHTAVIWMVIIMACMTVSVFATRRRLKWAVTGLVIIFLAFYAFRSLRIVKENYDNGLQYTSPGWQMSPTIEAVKNLPQDVLIISNETNAILFITGKPAYPLMEIYSDLPSQQFYRYGDGDLTQDEPQKLFREGKAVLVLFDTIDDQISGLYGDKTADRISALVKNLRRDFRGEDGGIFYYQQP